MPTPSREWITRGVLLALLAAIVGIPFLLRTDQQPTYVADDVVVIITPHNEAIRSEFARGFSAWYYERTGRTAAVDWRVIGGTSEIARFLAGEYTTSFQLHWERELGKRWTDEVRRSFDNPSIVPDDTPYDDTEAESARRAFLKSNVSSGIDLFFGGGSFDFIRQTAAGRLVDSGIFERRPEWFTDSVIPQQHNGEPFWAEDHTWVGAVLSGFGILYNRDSLKRLGFEHQLTSWNDLADPRLFNELALADPTKSSSIGKAFEMIIQRDMQVRLRELLAAGTPANEAEHRAVREGWMSGMQLVQLLGANARYFTDSSQKPPIDVAQGDAAAGMCIDFYGRSQAEAVLRRDGTPRLQFITPPGGSVYSVDPIATLRGPPSPELALDFIEYVMSREGQKLWNYRVGEADGPAVFSLRRLPVRIDSYSPEDREHMSDPDVNPFSEENDFVYRAEWTGGLFREMSILIRIMCLDAHDELSSAWRAIIDAGMPADALATLQDLSAIDYDTVRADIRQTLRSGDPVDEIKLRKSLAASFRANYRTAERQARDG